VGAESLVEVYRTQECRDKFEFKAVVTITYFSDSATLQGLSGSFTKKCWFELQDYLVTRGVTKVQYFRKGNLVTLDKPVITNKGMK
jgi:hypothetical protein